MHLRRLRLLLLPLALLAIESPAVANGHFVHGVGARNSGMGGAGAALPNPDVLTALAWNPALLAALEGDQVQLAMELVEASPELSSTVGPFSGTTEGGDGTLPVPAAGWARHRGGSRWAVGFGTLELAHFAARFPQGPGNPILAPQPQGFGRIHSDYEYYRTSLAAAYQATPTLSVGAALNLGYARFSVSPATFAAPDCSGPVTCFFPVADRGEAWGTGAQVGLHWQPVASWSFALAYATEQAFEDFELDSEVANPNLPTFGTARELELALDVPAVATAALAWAPSESVDLALDVRWIGFDGVDGLGTAGTRRDGSSAGFGWDDVVVVALGGEWRPSNRWALRAGYNLGESPVDEESAFASVAAPAVVEEIATLGVGYRVDERLAIDVTYWHGFENEVSTPFRGTFGPIPGTEVAVSNQADGLSASLGFRF